jgi:ribosomal protein S27AE
MNKSPKVKIVKVTLERHIPLMEKTCPQCGTQFMGVKIQRYCATACAKKASYWRNPEAYRESRIKNYRKQKEEVKK